MRVGGDKGIGGKLGSPFGLLSGSPLGIVTHGDIFGCDLRGIGSGACGGSNCIVEKIVFFGSVQNFRGNHEASVGARTTFFRGSVNHLGDMGENGCA